MKFLKHYLLSSCLTLAFFTTFAQPNLQPPTPAEQRLKAFEQRQELREKSLVANVPLKSIGPTVFSGRVADIDVSPSDPTHFYVAYASGGLWKTENNGQSFSPLFEKEAVLTIGDIAVDWKNNTIWVGSGEVNSSRSSYAGNGMYKSTDAGKNWTHLGLDETHHIGRIILHPENPDIVWVAALGHLYSPNQERGIYKTTDGGKTWNQTLFVNENAGAIELLIDPDDPNTLYAATWERTRRAWNFTEAGAGSGIYKSTDGGGNWELLSTKKSGFPAGEGVGRIGLALYKEGEKSVLYAFLDNYFRRPEEEEKKEDILTKNEIREMSSEQFLELETKEVSKFLKQNRFPEKYSAEKVIGMVKKEKIKPVALAEYLEDANSLLFDTPVFGAEVYRSDNGGKKWKKTHEGYLNSVYNSYGYYFGQIRISPHDPQKIYIMGVPILKSEDGGATFKSINGDNVHVDHHAIWASPQRDKHLIIGNDGGINITYDDGEQWVKCNTPAVGQFYYVAVDMAKSYKVYGGLQDNGVWYGPHWYEANTRWHNSGNYPYDLLLGGDGMQVAVDTRDNSTVYTGYQFGNYYRMNTKSGRPSYITPKHELGERPYRWNWQTPIHLSVHNQDILYMGGDKLFRSMNQGDDFKAISEDLTKGGQKGDVAFGTLASIHESPLRFGLLYAGSDDGLIHVSRDGGYSWQRISDDLPQDLWVSRIQASQHEEFRVYVTLNGYRWDHFDSYVYVSEDYGKTWQRIGTDIPAEPVNVIKEDPQSEDILYVGTDHGLYLSLDRGKSFMLMDKDLPAVPVHDVVVHPRENDLIVGTHGRSIYRADVSLVQQLTSIRDSALHVFKIDKTRYSSGWGNRSAAWRDYREPETEFPVYAKEAGRVLLTLSTPDSLPLFQKSYEVTQGINYLAYDHTIDETMIKKYEKELNAINEKKKEKEREDGPIELEKADDGRFYIYGGEYRLVFEKGGKKVEKKWVVE